ncbi:sialoadhesin-like [Colossoma macropomum]|uniref:sialoadhesin-like n=1 Tax=Colossoma macropomum TaxID=42526 RepID=UPI001863B9A2|nr:sialoadhesin-like [Colossoma macropomum]
MSSECGILSLITLLCVSGCLGESVSVSCSPQTVCALRGSDVNLNLKCSYSNINTKTVFWFSFKQKAKWRNETHPEDLALDSDYTGRVNTLNTRSSSTLTIRELRERDSGEYHLMIITEQGEKHSSPAVTVTVADLQLKMTQSGQEVTLTCSTSCSLTSKPDFYYWYKNSEYINRYTPYNMPQPLVLSSRADAGSYSCSVSSRSTRKSSPVGE